MKQEKDFLDDLTDNAGSVEVAGHKIRFRIPDAKDLGKIRKFSSVTPEEQDAFEGGVTMWTFAFVGQCLAASVIQDEKIRKRTAEEWTRVVYKEHCDARDEEDGMAMGPLSKMALKVCGYGSIKIINELGVEDNLEDAKTGTGDLPT